MSNTTLPLDEFRAIWVYSMDLSKAEWGALLSDAPVEGRPKPLPAALGLDFLDTDFIDFMLDEELRSFKLSDLLVEAHGMDRDLVAPDAAQLDALRGQVLLVHSRALGDRPPSVEPAPPLRFVGRYSEAMKNDAAPMAPAKSRVAAAAAAPDEAPAPKKRPSDAAMSGRIATLALLVMGLLVWLMIWVAG